MLRSSSRGDGVTTDHPLSGRRAEAAANDRRIIEAAREVFITDPEAPIAAAERAGVGISAVPPLRGEGGAARHAVAIGRGVSGRSRARPRRRRRSVGGLRRVAATHRRRRSRRAHRAPRRHLHPDRCTPRTGRTDAQARYALFKRTMAAGALRDGLAQLSTSPSCSSSSRSARLGDADRAAELRRLPRRFSSPGSRRVPPHRSRGVRRPGPNRPHVGCRADPPVTPAYRWLGEPHPSDPASRLSRSRLPRPARRRCGPSVDGARRDDERSTCSSRTRAARSDLADVRAADGWGKTSTPTRSTAASCASSRTARWCRSSSSSPTIRRCVVR